MAFEERELDEIRSRVTMSDLIGRYVTLRKQGSEYVQHDNPSFTVNDVKRFYKEFGHGGQEKPGDCFEYLVSYQGYSFVDAVKTLADETGVRLSGGGGKPAAKSDRKRDARESGDRQRSGGDAGPSRDGQGRADGDGRKAPQGKNEIVQTWDYVDENGALIYQTVRSQKRLQDGSWQLTKDGKPWKTFMQRRPAHDGRWIWALNLEDGRGNPQEFMLYRDAWLRFNEENFVNWKLTERRFFEDLSPIEHWLYNSMDVALELRQPRDEQRTIFLPEGEAKVDVLTEWNLLATTNSGGAGNFTERCARFFANAADVVILQDNDKAGSERADKLAAMLTAVGAGVRTLNFKNFWSECRPKDDVKDWRDRGGGTREQLLEIVDGLPAWTPKPYVSKFGARTGADLSAPVKPYPWRVKGIIPMNETLLIVGPSRSGKTFEVVDMAMHLCMEKPTFAGRKLIPCGVVYLAYEGVSGFENRIRSYLQHHGYSQNDLHSFAWLTRPPNLFSDEEKIEDLINEINEIASRFKLPLGVVIIDTHNASTRGASEVKSDEIGKIMNHHDMIAERTGATPWVVGHTNAEGKHRGNEQFFNRLETAMLIERVMEGGDKHGKGAKEKRDDRGRVIRRAKMLKQRDGSDEIHWDFVLEALVLGHDEDGDEIPGFVSVEPARSVPDDVIDPAKQRDRPEGFLLSDNNVALFKTLLKLIDGPLAVAPPPSLALPSSVPFVVKWTELGAEYQKVIPQEEGEDRTKYRNKIKSQTKRFREQLQPANVIGIASMPDPSHVPEDGEQQRMLHYVWPTGRRVFGRGIQWPKPKKKEEPKPIVDKATGQEITSIDGEPPSTVF